MICPYCTRKLPAYYGVGGGFLPPPTLPRHRCRECNGTCPGGPLPTLRPRKVCACHGPQPAKTDTDPRGGCPCRLRELGEAGYCTCEDLFPPFDRTEGYCEHGGWQCVCNACGLLAEDRKGALGPFLIQLRRLVAAGLCAQSHVSKTHVFAHGYPHTVWGGRRRLDPPDGPPTYEDSFEISSTALGYDISRNGVRTTVADSMDEAIDLVIASYEGKA